MVRWLTSSLALLFLFGPACSPSVRSSPPTEPAGPPWWDGLPAAVDWVALDGRVRGFESSSGLCGGGSIGDDKTALAEIGERVAAGERALSKDDDDIPAVAGRVHLYLLYARAMRVAGQRLRVGSECGAGVAAAATITDDAAQGLEQKVLGWLRAVPRDIALADRELLCRNLPLDPNQVPACAPNLP